MRQNRFVHGAWLFEMNEVTCAGNRLGAHAAGKESGRHGGLEDRRADLGEL
jgi:hypothetical protein